MPSISLRSPASSDTSFDERKDSMSSGLQLPAQDPECILKFDAVVTSLNGKSKEAFYTEFFVVKEDLESVIVQGWRRSRGLPNHCDLFRTMGAALEKIPFCFRECKKI